MKRWTIAEVIFYSYDNRKHALTFSPTGVTIISGNSSTGKSAIVSVIDYCLGSSMCEIPVNIRANVCFVALKLSNGTSEVFIAREVLPKESPSKKMAFVHGDKVRIPNNLNEFQGFTNREGARTALEQAIGIERIRQEGERDDRVSIRQATAFMFLSDEVIINKRQLFHGMKSESTAKHIIGALPYFLGAVSVEDVNAEYRIRDLTKAIAKEMDKRANAQLAEKEAQQKGVVLLAEAIAVGLLENIENSLVYTVEELIQNLKRCSEWDPKNELPYTNDDEDLLGKLFSKKRIFEEEFKKIGRLCRSTESYSNAAKGYEEIKKEQQEKVDVVTIFPKCEEIKKCPICSSSLTSAKEAQAILDSLRYSLKKEIGSTHKFAPEINKYLKELKEKQVGIRKDILDINNQIKSIIAQQEVIKAKYTAEQKAAVAVGRISYFLEELKAAKEYDATNLKRYEDELYVLENNPERHAKGEKLYIIKNFISKLANDFLTEILVGRLTDWELIFNADKATASLWDTGKENLYKMHDLGSDQNYLGIHLAVLFAIQRHLTKANRPVPATLIIDQISRPYYPEKKEELTLSAGADNDAIERCFRFIFNEVKQNEDLQVIILEHAYLEDMKEFKDATKYRWNKATGEKLIPDDWPTYQEL